MFLTNEPLKQLKQLKQHDMSFSDPSHSDESGNDISETFGT